MAFNRYADAKFDRSNPRTKNRVLAANTGFSPDYVVFIVFCSAGFITTCWFTNQLAFHLSVPALAVIFFYSFTKRFTIFSHFFLGTALALAPIGAWIAVREEFSIVSVTLGVVVVFWLAGLDTIYSCQDVEHDKKLKLNSIPQRFGLNNALIMASVFHFFMVVMLVVVAFLSNLSWLYAAGVIFTACMLFYEHSLVSVNDLSKVNMAFFRVNGVVSLGLMVFTILDVMILAKG